MHISPFVVIVEGLGKVANDPFINDDSSFDDRSADDLGRNDLTTEH